VERTLGEILALLDRWPSSDGEQLSSDEGVGDGRPGTCNHAAKGDAGDAHPFGGSLVIEAFEIGQAQGFELVHSEADHWQIVRPSADGFEGPDRRSVSDAAGVGRSSHVSNICS
jgi:hypothetical protein